MAENILTGGLEMGREIQRNLEELASSKANAEAAKTAIAQGEKNVKAKEKAVKDEIAATLKKRKEEIEQSFDTEVANLKQRTKEIKGEKDKDKDEQQARRIENETAGHREKERELLLEIRSIFKRDGVPGIFNTKLFYALFMPRSFGEVLTLLAAILITLVGLPTFISLVLIPEASRSTLVVILVNCACLLVFIGGYFLIAQMVAIKHRETFDEVLKLRREIRANNKDMNAVSRSVQRDKDDSKYNLGAYDYEIEKISDEVDAVLEKKKAALKEFENDTKQVITDQIMANNQAELNELRAFVETKQAEEKAALDRNKELGLYIATNYEPFIGKSDLNIDMIKKVVETMEAQRANTVGEAIAYVKQPPAPAEETSPAENNTTNQ